MCLSRAPDNASNHRPFRCIGYPRSNFRVLPGRTGLAFSNYAAQSHGPVATATAQRSLKNGSPRNGTRSCRNYAKGQCSRSVPLCFFKTEQFELGGTVQPGGTGQILSSHVFWTCHAGSRRSASLPRPMSGHAIRTWVIDGLPDLLQ